MPEKKQLNDEQLEKVSGGDALEDAIKQSLQEQEEERLKKLIEDVNNNRQQRTSEELSDSVDNLIDILKKLTGQDDSDGNIHIG